MGVLGLQSFMHKEKLCVQEGVCQKVSIPEMAAQYLASGKGKPRIVVNGRELVRLCLPPEFYAVPGNTWVSDFNNKIEHFAEQFEKFGVDLTVIFKNMLDDDKGTWEKMESASLEFSIDLDQFFSDVSSSEGAGRPNTKISKSKPFDVDLLFYSVFAFESKTNAELKIITGSLDEEIVKFAKENKCFAILGQDSDLVIQDTGAVSYLSLQELNFEDGNTVLYSRQKLAKRLRISEKQLPLFATLLGRSQKDKEKLVAFHKKIIPPAKYKTPHPTHTNMYILFPGVAKFISEKTRSNCGQDKILNMAVEMSAIGSNGPTLQELEDNLKAYELWNTTKDAESSSSPANPSLDAKIFTKLKELNEKGESHPFALQLLKFPKHFKICGLEKKGEDDTEGFIYSDLLYRPVRQRLYAVLLGEEATVEEFLVQSRGKWETVNAVPTVKDNPEMARDMNELWLDDDDPDRDYIRKETLRSCFMVTVPSYALGGLLTKYVPLVCVLNFWLSQRDSGLKSEDWEIDAFLATAVSQLLTDGSKIKAIIRDAKPDLRAVTLASCFVRGVTTFLEVLSVCGPIWPVSQVCPWNFFDGKLFHHFYVRIKNGEQIQDILENDEEAIGQLEELKKTIKLGLT